MHRSLKMFAALLILLWGAAAPRMCAAAGKEDSRRHPAQETGFLNRRIQIGANIYRYQVYLPEEWRRDDRKLWPVILFLHGRGERGQEGMWQTQIGLPQAMRDHPERWPFVVVMPQCSIDRYWTDKDMLAMAMAELDQETAEFHGDPARTYLSGLSMGGYGAWELARTYPTRWAAAAIAAGGIFWSYAPERWQQAPKLATEYAQATSRIPMWLFHGADDNIVVPRQDELLYAALKSAGGRVRFWLYLGLRHDCWTRAYLEPELPKWLLSHHVETKSAPPFAERTVIPLHPPALKLAPAQLDAFAGDFVDKRGLVVVSLFHQGDDLFQKNHYGEITELAAESLNVLFYPNGSSITRIGVERDPQGRVTGLVLRDDRHEERWERIKPALRNHNQPE
ncbi:alpha/beta hydrolase-fold protein [Occallatibacter savannae]|uniref:carboxylesterase family protein n=1 Tax=Occallatibacter savannae TaxID=1002691 RepID=UPI000D69EED1|nr:alpha/beta hydrolase-fold protein [Occallatibacter savannae]